MTSMTLIGHSVEGAEDWLTEVAHLFVQGAAESAGCFVRSRKLTAELEVASATLAQATQEQAAAEGGVRRCKSALDDITTTPVKWSGTKVGLIGALTCGLPAGLLLVALMIVAAGEAAGFLLVVLGLLGLVGGLVLTVALYLKHSAEKKARNTDIGQAEDAEQEAVALLDAAKAKVGEWGATHQRLQQELARNIPQRTISGVGWAYYPLVAADINGKPVLMDASRDSAMTNLQLPRMLAGSAEQHDQIDSLLFELAGLQQPPVLLEPTQDSGNQIDALVGEERGLRRCLDQYTELLKASAVVRRELPLVPRHDGLAQLAQSEQPRTVEGSPAGVVLAVQDPAELEASARALSETAGQQIKGREVGRVLTETYQSMKSLLDRYGDLRQGSLHLLHRELLASMRYSRLLSVVYYCPRCNRVPAYLYRVIGVPLEQAHQLDQRVLYNRLLADPEIKDRLERNANLERDLGEVVGRLTDLAPQLERARMEVETDHGGVGQDLAAFQQAQNLLRAFEGQYEATLQDYRAVLRTIVTGNAQPVYELNREARLYLEPNSEGVWTCATCGTVFDDPKLLAMGCMLKLREQVVLPMWNHLWAEKADMRKHELFRTNDALQRMNEKESEKLLRVAEQFKADMRPVREHLIELTSEAVSKKEQLLDTLEGLVSMGLITQEKASIVHGDIDGMMSQDETTFIKKAEAKESLLATEPQAQSRRRKARVEPVELLAGPEVFFQESAPPPGVLGQDGQPLVDPGGPEHVQAAWAAGEIEG